MRQLAVINRLIEEQKQIIKRDEAKLARAREKLEKLRRERQMAELMLNNIP